MQLATERATARAMARHSDRGIELRGGCEAGCARRRRRRELLETKNMDVVLDDGKTCANVTHGAQRGRAGEGMDVMIVGIEGMCEQECVPAKRAGGCERAGDNH